MNVKCSGRSDSTMAFTGFKSVVWLPLTVISLILCLISTTAAESREAVSSALDCELNNDTYICNGAQYRMQCNTKMHRFSYQTYQDQNQYQCMSNDCICVGNKDTCVCYYNTSSCFCESFNNSITIPTAVTPVYACGLYNDTYICTGAQYRMHCNTSVHDFHYSTNHYHCLNNNCYCIGNKDTCTCFSSTLSSCFCETNGNSIAAGVTPVYDCGLYNDTYICTGAGAQYRMYCNTRLHSFYYQRYRSLNQQQYECWSNNCGCIGNNDTCTCYSSTLSSCFCETFNNSITIPTAVSPVTKPDCMLQNDMYICTGSQYRMYCNTQMHDFSYQIYQFQYQYHCVNNNCNCRGNKDTCTCSSSTLSSCFCETYGNSTALSREVSPASGCVLYNDTQICTGAQYRMYCNTRMHSFYYWEYQYQDQNQYLCIRNDCNCRGNKDTCTCYSSSLSSCFCETYGNSTALSREVSPPYGCVLYNNMYICTGAQYRMYCNTSVHDFYYWKYQYQNQYMCIGYGCFCFGLKDTCTCYSTTLSSCFCETYNNNITIPTAVSPLRLSHCVFYNDTYICTGAQYRLHCNTSVHDFYYLYQNQNQYEYQCWNDCDCVGNKDTCTCYYSTLSSCFCETNTNYIALTTAVTPVYDCGIYNGTSYICTGAQYRMHCNTSEHDFHYNKSQYHCLSDKCDCIGNNDTCTCSSSTLSSCFCETYGNSTALSREVSSSHGCVLYNNMYICTGAQYRMYCNTKMHNFYYLKYQYQNQDQDQYLCIGDCICIGNKDTCTCYSTTLSSCFCETYNNNITIPTAVSPLRLFHCMFSNDTYICTGAQYRMHCNTSVHDFYYLYQNQNQYEYQCWNNDCDCVGNNDTCTCSSSTLSSCFCEYNISTPTTLSPTTTGLDNELPDQCTSQGSGGCFQNLIDKIENITTQKLSLDTVTSILTMIFNASEKILESSSSVSPAELASNGNRVLKTSNKLVSTLVKPTDTSANVSFTLETVEVQVFMIGPTVAFEKIPRLDTTNSSMDIDLIGIAKNNGGSAAVAFMSYNTMENLLKPDFFNTPNDTIKTMMSTVISATLPKTTNTKLTKPVNFTLKHIREFDPNGSLSCVYWNTSEWIVDGCSVLKTNSSYTVCSCVHLSTFALMQTSSRQSESTQPLDLVTFVCVGLVLFSLAVLAFALCQWSRTRYWICGHSGCVRPVPKGYVRELSGSSTRASDVFAVDSNQTTSKESQEIYCNITLTLEHVNQNISSNANSDI